MFFLFLEMNLKLDICQSVEVVYKSLLLNPTTTLNVRTQVKPSQVQRTLCKHVVMKNRSGQVYK